MTTILLVLGILLLSFAGIAIKLWAKKDGEFSGTCASQSPFLREQGGTCGYCGKNLDEVEDTCKEAPQK